jgi:hypothetical protein
MFSSGFVMLNLMMVLLVLVRSTPTPLEPLAEAHSYFGVLHNSSTFTSEIVVPTNQGIFASSESLLEVKAKAKHITPAEMLKRTGGDGSALLENAWVRASQGDHMYHISLLLKFADEKCERMEFYPDNGPEDVLGEHPTGRVILSSDTASAACANAVSFLGIPKSGGVGGLASLMQLATFAMTSCHDGDFLRWTKADEKINRRELYGAFIQEAARFKDEKKYGCASFAHNVFEDASNQKFIDRSTIVSLIQSASKLGMQCTSGGRIHKC